MSVFVITSLANPILLALLPAAAVSSQSLLDLLLAALFIGLITKFFHDKRIFIFEKIGIEWAFAGYVIVVCLGFWLNASRDAEWLRSAIKFSWILNFYILFYGLQTINVNSLKIIKVLSVGTLLPTLYSLASYIHGVDLITGRDNVRITGLVNSATYHAHGNAVLFIFLVGTLFFSFKKLNTKWKVFSLISTVLLGLSILLTFTRGIWLSAFISSAIMLFFLDRRKMVKFVLTTLIIAWLSAQFWPAMDESVDLKSRPGSTGERINFIKLNLQMWQEYPLLGIGYGENIRRCREYWDKPEWRMPEDYIISHAHNQYLNVLSTTGLFGLFFFSSFFLYFINKNIKLIFKTSSVKTPERWALLITCLWAQIEFALACLTDVSFEYAKIRILILFVWALVVVIEKKPSVVTE